MTIHKEKCRCKNSFYWNLTQPYFDFIKGNVYECQVRTHDNGAKVYSFDFCDYAEIEAKFKQKFETIEDIRDNKLTELGI